MEYASPLSLLYRWEKEIPDKVYLRQPIDGVWHEWTWKQTAGEVRKLAMAIKALGLPPNSHIALLSKNCAHWFICDLAIMMAGHISIPLYPSLQKETVKIILERSESVVLFAGKLDNWEEVKDGIPAHIKCITFPFCHNDRCESWDSFTQAHEPIKENIERNLSDIVSIIYTSGTSGEPKGAVFSFEAFAFVIQHALVHVKFKQSDRFFSYLPLSHIAERMLVEMVSVYTGAQVSFAESLQSFAQNLAESRPTIFLGVHRIWTRMHQGILAKMPEKKLNMILKVPILSNYIKKKIRKSLGLNDTSMIFTGAAPTPPDLIKWFRRLGIHIQEAYAMTENCCYSHVSLKDKIKIGFVGQPLPYCEVRLGENNEIEIKHKGMMKGYYNEPNKTAESFTDDGFFKTGDEGFIDEEGFLKITGRIKDIFKTAKGKYVAPSPIEMKFSTSLVVEQVCVVGSGLAQPMALLTLSEFGKKRNEQELHVELSNAILNINTHLDDHEKLNKIIVLKEPWLIENNLLTPSMKIKRNEIEKRYDTFYTNWYSHKGSVLIIAP